MQMNPNPYGSVELENFSVDRIRNFSIIAHVGKDASGENSRNAVIQGCPCVTRTRVKFIFSL